MPHHLVLISQHDIQASQTKQRVYMLHKRSAGYCLMAYSHCGTCFPTADQHVSRRVGQQVGQHLCCQQQRCCLVWQLSATKGKRQSVGDSMCSRIFVPVFFFFLSLFFIYYYFSFHMHMSQSMLWSFIQLHPIYFLCKTLELGTFPETALLIVIL